MKVIKVVYPHGGKLVSTFAEGSWQKEYAKGVETTPDVGYLFAYAEKNLRVARRDMGSPVLQFWLAEAEVVSSIRFLEISIERRQWRDFWKLHKLRLQNRGTEFLLCSSITLVEQLK